MLKELIAECNDCEFKERVEISKPKSWLKTVSAFANGIGGKIFFGIADDQTLKNISNPKQVIAKITDLIDKYILPRPFYRLTPYKEEDSVFIELRVNPGDSTPYYYNNEGNPIAFIRSGSSSIEAPEYILNELILKGTGKTYDGIVTGFKKDDFSFSILEHDFLERTGSRFTDQDYVSFGLATKSGNLTNAGVLLADTNPYRHSRLFCTCWNGFDKTNENEAEDDKEFDGSLIRQLKMAMDFFKVNTKNPWHKEATGTIYEPDYDEQAILESLVNGIIHRNYNNLGAEVCLNIYEDRIEITSPGVMVSGDPLPKYIDYNFESMRRNPLIADVFWRLGYMNRRGSGLAKITNRTNALFKDGKEHVSFQIRNSFFVVTIDNANYDSRKTKNLTDREAKIIKMLKPGKKSISELSKTIGANRKTIRLDLQRLEDLNLVECNGKTRDKYWQLA